MNTLKINSDDVLTWFKDICILKGVTPDILPLAYSINKDSIKELLRDLILNNYSARKFILIADIHGDNNIDSKSILFRAPKEHPLFKMIEFLIDELITLVLKKHPSIDSIKGFDISRVMLDTHFDEENDAYNFRVQYKDTIFNSGEVFKVLEEISNCKLMEVFEIGDLTIVVKPNEERTYFLFEGESRSLKMEKYTTSNDYWKEITNLVKEHGLSKIK